MKKLICISLLLFSLTTQAQFTELTRPDRLLHLSAGYVITSVSASVLVNYTQTDWQAEILAFRVGVAAVATLRLHIHKKKNKRFVIKYGK